MAAGTGVLLAIIQIISHYLRYSGIYLSLSIISRMESQAQNLEGVLKNNNVFLPTKLALLAKLKANIKHQHVPLPAISPCFEVVRTAISSPELLEQGFSILSHLTKRLLLQDQGSILASQATKTYPYVIHSMGDSKDRVRIRAAQALTDFWTSFHADVEQALRDTALDSEVPAVKENAMQWIIKVRNGTDSCYPYLHPYLHVSCRVNYASKRRNGFSCAVLFLLYAVSLNTRHFFFALREPCLTIYR